MVSTMTRLEAGRSINIIVMILLLVCCQNHNRDGIVVTQRGVSALLYIPETFHFKIDTVENMDTLYRFSDPHGNTNMYVVVLT